MSGVALPPELAALLARLRRRGLPVGVLETHRLQHLLGQDGALADGRLPGLLTALICKDQAQRDALAREYRAWADEFRLAPADGPGPAAAPTPAVSPPPGPVPAPETPGPAVPSGPSWPRRFAALVRPRRLASAAVLLTAGALGWWVLQQPAWPPEPDGEIVWPGPTPPPPTGALCPQDLPTDPVTQVWAWVPVPDFSPWVALALGIALGSLALVSAWRLWRSPRRWFQPGAPLPGAERAPRHGLPPLPASGDLLLGPKNRRELVWSIDHYVSDEPDRALDPVATVAATARAGGLPHLIPARCTFPRQVWLWCDRQAAPAELLERLAFEVERALTQASLPVRVASFHGLPSRLAWADTGEPFTPAGHEGAGAAALVAVLTDGAGLLRAWQAQGERPALERLLRELRAWPRLLLVDLGDGALAGLATELRLPVRGAEGLAPWLARQAAPAPRPAPLDRAQLDLWAGACLLLPRPLAAAEALALRRALGLALVPFAWPALAGRLAEATADPALAARLRARLARSQTLDADGRPQGDGWLTRALDYWERRLADAARDLPVQDPAARAALDLQRVALGLWRDPARASAALLPLVGGRRQRDELRALWRYWFPAAASADAAGPTWQPDRLPVRVRFRLMSLGLGPAASQRVGARHHLLLALFAGAALAALGSGLERLARPHQGGPFADDLFQAQVLALPATGRTWLGSPWHLTPLPGAGPLDTPHGWQYRPLANPSVLAPGASLLSAGTRAFPMRPCTPGWPRRSLAVVAAPSDDADARALAIRLLDRGSADRVLLAPDWPAHLSALTQGLRVPPAAGQPGDQLLVFLPAGAPVPDGLAGTFEGLALIRGDWLALARALDFPVSRPVVAVWPGAEVRAGAPQVAGGPAMDTDGAGVTWVEVCGGSFLMGMPESQPVGLDDERPARPVVVPTFRMARTELTNDQARAVGLSSDGDGSLPFTDNDWLKARDACASLGGDLPTEAQWEYAARAGTATAWSFGDDESGLGDYAWFEDNADRAQTVGQKLPNGLCVADLHGNVWEWTRECWDDKAYRTRGPLTLDRPDADIGNCEGRVVRGGSFAYPPDALRSANRADVRPINRNDLLGLRCVRSGAPHR